MLTSRFHSVYWKVTRGVLGPACPFMSGGSVLSAVLFAAATRFAAIRLPIRVSADFQKLIFKKKKTYEALRH